MHKRGAHEINLRVREQERRRILALGAEQPKRRRAENQGRGLASRLMSAASELAARVGRRIRVRSAPA
jgi:hypothetical protein